MGGLRGGRVPAWLPRAYSKVSPNGGTGRTRCTLFDTHTRAMLAAAGDFGRSWEIGTGAVSARSDGRLAYHRSNPLHEA